MSISTKVTYRYIPSFNNNNTLHTQHNIIIFPVPLLHQTTIINVQHIYCRLYVTTHIVNQQSIPILHNANYVWY